MRILMARETGFPVIPSVEILSMAVLADGLALLKHEATVEPLGGGIRLPVGLVREEGVAAPEVVAARLSAGGADPALEIGPVAVLAVSEAHGGHVVPVEDERAGIGRRLPGFAVAPKRWIPGRPVRAHRTVVAAPEAPGEGVLVVHEMAVLTGPCPAIDHGVQSVVHHPDPVELGLGRIRPRRGMGPSRGAVVAIIEAVTGRIRLAHGMAGDAIKGPAVPLHEDAVEVGRGLVIPARRMRRLGFGEDISPAAAPKGEKDQEEQRRKDDDLRAH